MKSHKNFRSSIMRLFEPVYQMPWPYISGSIKAISWVIFDIAMVFVAQYVGNLIQDNSTSGTSYLMIFWRVFLGLVIYTIIKYIIRHRGWVAINTPYNARISSIIYKKYFHIDQTYIEKIGTGRIINIINDGVNNRVNLLLVSAHDIIYILIKLIFAGYFVFKLGLRYGASFFVGLGLVFVFVVHLNKKVSVIRTRRKEKEIERSRHNVRMIVGKQEIIQNYKEQDEISLYDHHSENIQKSEMEVNNVIWYTYNVPIFFVGLVSIASVAYAGLTMDDGSFALGTYTALVALSGMLTSTIIRITENFNALTKSRTHIEKLWDFLDNGPVAHNITNGPDFEGKSYQIKLSDVVFSYEDSDSIINDISLTIDGSSKTALVGPSGGGKSTIVKLIAGYLRPDEGKVFIDEQDLNEVNLKSYYKHIGYLTQEPSVFDGTIQENLAYAADNISDEEIKQAISDAQCDFIWDLADGLSTEIGERGVRLSGGQRQRLAIAKIFLKNPEIVILDEPTSALDSESEEKVTIAMNRLFEGRTVIVIAHRLQTVKHSDIILYIENGTILEQGNHKELMTQKGKYHSMVELQSGF